MKIILLRDIPKIGKKYEEKNISDGYAINMLIPRGLAVSATPDVLRRVHLEKSRDEGERKVRKDLILKNLGELDGQTITLVEKANEKGHLFAQVHKPEIVAAIEKQTRVQIDPEFIMLDKHIKEIGVHEVEIRSEGKSVKVNIDIKAK